MSIILFYCALKWLTNTELSFKLEAENDIGHPKSSGVTVEDK